MTPTLPARPSPTALTEGSRWPKVALWLILGAMTMSVVLYTEVPIFHHPRQLIPNLINIPWVLIPHVLGGTLALVLGAVQFSRRLRQHRPQLHRILGRAYVVSVLVAAPLSFILAGRVHEPEIIYFRLATGLQGATWLIVTLAAYLTARHRHIRQHREWMVRSYALTFTFVGTRLLQPIPAWNRLGHVGFAMAILIITFLALLIPDIALHWRELTTQNPALGARSIPTSRKLSPEQSK
jgi:uncharacterized membrane protein